MQLYAIFHVARKTNRSTQSSYKVLLVYVANVEDDFVPHLRPKAEKMSFSMGLFELLIQSSMLATNIPIPSSDSHIKIHL